MIYDLNCTTPSGRLEWIRIFNDRLSEKGLCIKIRYYHAVAPLIYDMLKIYYCERDIVMNSEDLIYYRKPYTRAIDNLIHFLNADAYDFLEAHKTMKVKKNNALNWSNSAII